MQIKHLNNIFQNIFSQITISIFNFFANTIHINTFNSYIIFNKNFQYLDMSLVIEIDITLNM
jgi:hypothetical protein